MVLKSSGIDIDGTFTKRLLPFTFTKLRENLQSLSYRIIFETGVPIGVIVGQVIAFLLTEEVALISMSAKNMQTYA